MTARLAILRGGVMAVVMTAMTVGFAEPYVVTDAWTDTPAAEVVTGGLLRFAVPGPPRTYNPLLSVETNLVVGLNTETTFGAAVLGWWRPDDGTLEPRAAESFEVSADGLTITITLRPELRWSDGEPITAQDYVISYWLQVDPETGAAGPERWTVGDALITVEASGTRSLVVRIPTFDRLALQTVANHYPLPDHVFGHATGPVERRRSRRCGVRVRRHRNWCSAERWSWERYEMVSG